MKISSIPQIYRNANRWREILSILSKYELASWIDRVGPEFIKDLLKSSSGTALARLSWETRIRMALTELGPTFIKLGQVLSTRPDLVGPTLALELQHLQTNVPADPTEMVHETIRHELGCPLEEQFTEFSEEPIASASIGQVHEAKLLSGEHVVVKVQHANIKKKMMVDLDILSGLAVMAERIPEFQNYRPVATAMEFQRALRRELDFGRELRNMERFATDFKDDETVHIPQAYPRLSTERILTMEFVQGTKLTDTKALENSGANLRELARRGANIYLSMIFKNGFYHADPHPGNSVILHNNVIGLLDHGMVGQLNGRLQDQIGEMFFAIINQDAESLTTIITRIGSMPSNLDRVALGIDIADFISYYGSQSLDQFNLSGALTEMTDIIRRYRIMLPAAIAMLLKVLITLEGTSKLLCPDFSLIEIMAPYQKIILARRYSPRRQFRKLQKFLSEMEHFVEDLPLGLSNIFQQIETGKFDVHLDHRGLEPSVNRIVLGMLASALMLSSAMLLSNKVQPLAYIPYLCKDISIAGALGAAVSIGIGLRLWRAINKSGRLDRRE